jgi:hypothetical protein
VAATSTPVGERRGRRVSCTVALAVAGAMALVLLGVGVLFDVLPGMGPGDQRSSAQDGPAASASAGTGAGGAASGDPSTGADSQADEATALAPYAGTWQGTVEASAAGITVPAGTVTLTVTDTGAKTIGTVQQVDVLGASACADDLVLVSADAKELIATSVPTTKGDSRCVQTTSTVSLRRAGDGLEYASRNAEAGMPSGLLAKKSG